MKNEPMNYFKAIVFRVEQIDALAQSYLDKLPFISNPEILEKLWEKAKDLFSKANEDWDNIPEWAANFLDGWPPYSPSTSGSLYVSLGTSCVSRDAHLRNLLERVESRETKELDFPILAEKSIVNKLAGLKD